MKILITSHYFFPENFFINDIAKKLNNLGNDVSIATGKPNYPAGLIYKDYKFLGLSKDYYEDDIVIYRIPVIPRGKSKFQLFLNYISFVLFGTFLFPYILRNQKFDIILHFGAGPITSVLPFLLIKFLKKIKLIIWVQDLYPDTLKSFPIVNNNFFISIVGVLVRFIYFFADKILIQSKSFENSVKKYTNKKNINYYSNSSIDIKLLQKNKYELPSRLNSILRDNKSFIFAGNLGEAQSVETLIKCAEELSDLHKFKLVLVGNGSKLEWIKSEVTKKNLDNVFIAGSFNSEKMANVYDLAYGLVLTLKNETHLNYTIPSKLQTYLSAGKPIVAALSGEAGKIINDSGAGFACDSENYLMLSRNIRKLISMSEDEIRKMSDNSREYYIKNFEINKKVSELEKILKNT